MIFWDDLTPLEFAFPDNPFSVYKLLYPDQISTMATIEYILDGDHWIAWYVCYVIGRINYE